MPRIKLLPEVKMDVVLLDPKNLAVAICRKNETANGEAPRSDSEHIMTMANADKCFEDFLNLTDISDETKMSIILETLENIHVVGLNQNNCYWNVISNLFERLWLDAASASASNVIRRPTETMNLLKEFFTVTKKSYEKYLNMSIKVKLPAIALILRGKTDNKEDFMMQNFENLIVHLFDLVKFREEYIICKDWANLVLRHYLNYNTGPTVLKNMVSAFRRVSATRATDVYGLTVLRWLQTRFVHSVVVDIVETLFPETGIQDCKYEDDVHKAQVKILKELSSLRCVVMRNTDHFGHRNNFSCPKTPRQRHNRYKLSDVSSAKLEGDLNLKNVFAFWRFTYDGSG